MKNISIIPTKQPKKIKIVREFELLNSEGPVLSVLFKYLGSYQDVFLKIKCIESNNYLIVKTKPLILIKYIRNGLSMQELLIHEPFSTFIFQLYGHSQLFTNIEMSFDLIFQFRLSFAENHIDDIPEDCKTDQFQKLLSILEKNMQTDPYGEEETFEGEEIKYEFEIDASIYIS